MAEKTKIDWQFNDEYYKYVLIPQIQEMNVLVLNKDYTNAMTALYLMINPFGGAMERHNKAKWESLWKLVQETIKLSDEYEFITFVWQGNKLKRMKKRQELIQKIRLNIDKIIKDFFDVLDHMNMFLKRIDKNNPDKAVYG